MFKKKKNIVENTRKKSYGEDPLNSSWINLYGKSNFNEWRAQVFFNVVVKLKVLTPHALFYDFNFNHRIKSTLEIQKILIFYETFRISGYRGNTFLITYPCQ